MAEPKEEEVRFLIIPLDEYNQEVASGEYLEGESLEIVLEPDPDYEDPMNLPAEGPNSFVAFKTEKNSTAFDNLDNDFRIHIERNPE